MIALPLYPHKTDSIMKRLLICIIVCATGLMSANAQQTESIRMDRSKMNIGAYILQPYARTEQHVKEIADCGIDFMTWIPNDRRLLDLFQKYHIGAIVSDVVPGLWGGDGDKAGTLSQRHPIELYEKRGNLVKINAAGSMDEVFENLKAVVK